MNREVSLPPEDVSVDESSSIDIVVELVTTAGEQPGSQASVLFAHYHAIECIRRSPRQGVALVGRIASKDNEQHQAHAALLATHLASDQPLHASDIWVYLRNKSPLVSAAVGTAVRAALGLGYVNYDEAALIHNAQAGLRTTLHTDDSRGVAG